MTWIWLNIALAVPFFLATTLIPLRMVHKDPDADPGVPATNEHPPGRPAAALADSAGSVLAPGELVTLSGASR